MVGDVVGRGLEAAATMGQLRSAARALASTGLSPAALLDALDRFSRRHGVGQMATVAYADLDLATGHLRYACAGHPPPAIAEPGRDPRFAWDGRSTPLDAHGVPHPRPEAALDLAAGTTVLLYTDGLFERHDRPLRSGLDALLAGFAGVRDEPPDAIAAHLIETLAGPGDDVCVLALQGLPVPALVSVLVAARDAEGTIDALLAGLGAQTHPRVEVVVADDGSRDGTASGRRRRAPG